MRILENQKVFLMSIIFMLFTIIFGSCTKVDVYFPTQFVKENKVIINGKHDLVEYIQEREYSVISLGFGTNEVSINGEPREIHTMNGGMLNLNQEEFIVFTLIYGKAYVSPLLTPFSVVLDSTFYYQDSYNERTLDRLRQDGNRPYDPKTAEIFGFAVINKGDFFAEKSWDFDMYDEVPRQMKVRVRENSGNAIGGKRTIRSAKMFHILSKLGNKYNTIDLKD